MPSSSRFGAFLMVRAVSTFMLPDNDRDHPVAASKLAIWKRLIRDLGASHCSSRIYAVLGRQHTVNPFDLRIDSINASSTSLFVL
jgi:hypothetical protein